MAGKVTGQWQKFPAFIEYANDSETFQCKTQSPLPHTSRWTTLIFLDLKSPTIGIRRQKLDREAPYSRIILFHGKAKWSREMASEVLATNQNEFRMLLDGIIDGNFSHVHLQLMEEHASHLWTHPSWANLSREKLDGLVLIGFHDRGLQYSEYILIQDPLDGLYWQLREFLRLGGEQRLRKCPVCKRFFIQSTARPARYCIRKCRLNSDPSRRETDAEYHRQYRKKQREKRIDAEFERIQEAKARLEAEGKENPDLGWVLYEAGIDEKRWNYLCRSEEKKNGRRRLTDLIRP